MDTGAETNLIGKDLMPHLMKASPDPLALITADGTRMRGGSKEVTLQLCFHTNRPNQPSRMKWCTKGTFHDAEIQVDAILSYPLLEKAQLGVFPHLESPVRLD